MTRFSRPRPRGTDRRLPNRSGPTAVAETTPEPPFATVEGAADTDAADAATTAATSAVIARRYRTEDRLVAFVRRPYRPNQTLETTTSGIGSPVGAELSARERAVAAVAHVCQAGGRVPRIRFHTEVPRSTVTLAVGLSAAALIVSAGTWTSTGAAAASRCRTDDLVVWLDTQGDGAAGSIYYKLELTNLSAKKCRLLGYPGVSAVDLRGRQLGTAATRDTTRRAHLVTLAPRGTATAVLRVVEADNFPASTCRQVTAAGLRVYPPGQRAAKVVPFPFRACSRRGPVYLSIRPVQAA